MGGDKLEAAESHGRGVRLVRATEGLYRRLFVGTILFGIAAPAWELAMAAVREGLVCAGG